MQQNHPNLVFFKVIYAWKQVLDSQGVKVQLQVREVNSGRKYTKDSEI